MAPEPEPPLRDLTPAQWVRANLASTPLNALLTVVVGLIAAWAALPLARWVFVTGDWAVVRVNLKLFMVGFYPPINCGGCGRPATWSSPRWPSPVARSAWRYAGPSTPPPGSPPGTAATTTQGAAVRAVAAVTSVPGPGGVGGSSACCSFWPSGAGRGRDPQLHPHAAAHHRHRRGAGAGRCGGGRRHPHARPAAPLVAAGRGRRPDRVAADHPRRRRAGRLGRLGRPAPGRVGHRGGGHRARLPAGAAPGARAPLVAARHPHRVDRLHRGVRAVPWSRCCSSGST